MVVSKIKAVRAIGVGYAISNSYLETTCIRNRAISNLP